MMHWHDEKPELFCRQAENFDRFGCETWLFRVVASNPELHHLVEKKSHNRNCGLKLDYLEPVGHLCIGACTFSLTRIAFYAKVQR